MHVPTTHELLHEVFEGLTHGDSRLWSTLRTLWLKPGELTLEYVRGRRAAYVPPFRLYLVISVIFFLVAANVEFELATLQLDPGQASVQRGQPLSAADCAQLDPFRDTHPGWDERLRQGCAAATRDSGHSWTHLAMSLLPKAMFVFVPLIALLHMLMYWWPRHRYAEHWVFFLHLHAFFYSVMGLVLLVARLGSAAPPLHGVCATATALLQLGLPVYALLALKRVFAGGWPLTLLKGVVLFFAYSILLGVTMGAVFLYAALQL